MLRRFCLVLGFLMLFPVVQAWAQAAQGQTQAEYIREHYQKQEVHIPMRDGARLFTSIYMPKDSSQSYPIMLQRTPYSVRPYGDDLYKSRLGPSMLFAEEGYIFVYQDVRGKMMSEGEFEAVRPHNPAKRGRDIDESSDTYDTVQWLLDNLNGHNERVGVWGISAPGFYATHSLIDAHPAVKAVSPQAPVTDWFIGDDRHHNGAFLIQATFSFLSSYGASRPEPTTKPARGFRDYGTPDGYAWYKELGAAKNVNARYFKGENKIWNDMMQHGTYDAFWQARTPLPHLTDVKPAVLVVGGFFDAQDLYGPLKTYGAIERQNPSTPNHLVMGPWWHGGWARGDGDRYLDIYFEKKTGPWYRETIELPFFNHYLKDKGTLDLPEATIFISGSNEWHTFDQWPPREATTKNLYLQPNMGVSFEAPVVETGFAEYVSDPNKPVPHTPKIVIRRDDRYVVQDQRFAASRPDVLVFESEVLTEDVTLAGTLFANLFVTTTGTDADYIVKLIDVYPGDMQVPDAEGRPRNQGGFQFMVRGEVMRAKFRNSFEYPEPMMPGEATKVRFDMQDVAHTFKAGHKIMVHIQSTWFPLVDINPQQFLDIYQADPEDYQKATHQVHFSREHPSHLEVMVLEKE